MKLIKSTKDYFLGKKTLFKAFIIWCLGYILITYTISISVKFINYLTSGNINILLNNHKIELYILQELSLVLYAFIIVPLSVIVISKCWKNTKRPKLGRIVSIIYYIYSFAVIFIISDAIKHIRVNSDLFFTNEMPLHYDTRLYWYLLSISIIVNIWVTHKEIKDNS